MAVPHAVKRGPWGMSPLQRDYWKDGAACGQRVCNVKFQTHSAVAHV